ncbi:MAG TPA: PepSY domain-containing protein [Nitrospiria bacterium]|nr:PepSY domain-containing protein [Nitrospiria bacterium]
MFGIMHKIHRFIGLISIILIVFFTITGVILTHREGLTLYDRAPSNGLILWLYGYSGEVTSQEEIDGVTDDFVKAPPSLERVITAFHASRFFGRPVPLFLDILSLSLFLLVVTGSYIWIKRALILKRSKKAMNEVEEEVFLQGMEGLLRVKEKAKVVLLRAEELHNLSEHLPAHTREDKEEKISEREMADIERDIKELDSRVHRLIKNIKGLEKGA